MNKYPVLSAILSMALGSSMHAALVVSSEVGGAPLGSCLVNFDDLPLGTQTGASADGPSGSVTVTTTGNASVVIGTNNPFYAAPVLSGLNGMGFGPGGTDQPDGPDTTPYLQAGNVQGGGSVELTFSSPQTFLGLLWGSVDDGTNDIDNHLAFYDGATLIGILSGDDVGAVLGDGDQTEDGTARVIINSDVPFDRVVATSSGDTNGLTFEFDNISFDCATGCVRSQGFWKNHAYDKNNKPSAWTVDSLMLGEVVYTKDELLDIFNTPVKGNGLVSLAYQLIAAKLNVAAGAYASPDVIAAINAADALIGMSEIPPHGTATISPDVTNALKDFLDAYNNGRAGTDKCQED